jgi:hypothetical protein
MGQQSPPPIGVLEGASATTTGAVESQGSGKKVVSWGRRVLSAQGKVRASGQVKGIARKRRACLPRPRWGTRHPKFGRLRMDLQRRRGAAPRSRRFFTKRAKVAVRVQAPRAANNERNELPPLHWSPSAREDANKISGQDHHRIAVQRNAPIYLMSGRDLKRRRPISRLPPNNPCHGLVSKSVSTTGRTRTVNDTPEADSRSTASPTRAHNRLRSRRATRDQ